MTSQMRMLDLPVHVRVHAHTYRHMYNLLTHSLRVRRCAHVCLCVSATRAAVAGFQGAVWGSLVLCLLFLVVFNFLRT